MTSYQSLCSEYYENFKSLADAEEIAFYSSHLKKVQGPILEAMCGTGRILFPLLKEGYPVDGVDNAGSMLEICEKKCSKANLKVNLFNQAIEHLSLPKKYALIFVALGSFQHFADRKTTALKALQNLHDHLQPGGTLLIDMILPWGLIKESIEDSFLSHEVKTLTSSNSVVTPEGFQITSNTSTKVYPEDQLAISHNKYEKSQNGKVLKEEEEQLAFRWYHRYEMELFLEKAGFTVQKIWNKRFEPGLQSTVYEANIKR